RFQLGERIEIERDLLVRMRLAQRTHGVGGALGRDDGLDAQLRDALLPPDLADRGIGSLAGEKRTGARGVPRAALVVADAARPGREDGVTRRVQCLPRHEPDELVLPRLAHARQYRSGA